MVLGYNNDDGAQALDQQQEIDFRRGWQVVDADSGSNLVTDGTGTYEVDVAAGDINTPTGTVTCSAATLDLESLVDPDLPRIVVVYRDGAGVAQTLAGTPAAKQPTGETAPGALYQPAPDAFSTTDGVVLATVLLEAAASSVGGAQIRDRRMPASLNVDSAEVGSLNTKEIAVGSTSDTFLDSGSRIQIADGRADDPLPDVSNTSYQSQGAIIGGSVDVTGIPDNVTLQARQFAQITTPSGSDSVSIRPQLISTDYSSIDRLDELELTSDADSQTVELDSGWTDISTTIRGDVSVLNEVEAKVSGGTASWPTGRQRYGLIFAWLID